jgi:DNA-binding transcriptional ArsR family regulator
VLVKKAANNSMWLELSGFYSGHVETDRAGMLGDVELSEVGALLADRGRCRMLMALDDGRALPASVLADEARVSRSTASSHLGKLTEAGLLRMEKYGRHRYYRLAGPAVGELLEKLTRLAPSKPVRSLREGTRAAHLRSARTCYDHLAGQLGVAVMTSLLDRERLIGGDGLFHPDSNGNDRPSGSGWDVEYSVTPDGRRFLHSLDIEVPPDHVRVRYCVDWSEQRHHLAGALGRSVLNGFLSSEWIRRRETGRSVEVTLRGRKALSEHFGIDWDVPTLRR